MRSYLDLFGNRVTRVEVPAGLVTFSDRFVIQDLGEPDETPPDVHFKSSYGTATKVTETLPEACEPLR